MQTRQAHPHAGMKNPRWLAKVKRGLAFMLAALALAPAFAIGGCIGLYLAFAFGYNDPDSSATHFINSAVLLYFVCGPLIFCLLLGFSAWQIANKEDEQQTAQPSGRAVRRVFVPGLALVAAAILIALGDSTTTSFIAVALLTAGSVLIVIGFLSLASHLREIAEHNDQEQLAMKTDIVRWWGSICLAGVLAMGVIYATLLAVDAAGANLQIADSSAARPLLFLSVLLFVFLALGLIVFGVWFFALICRYYKLVSAALKNINA